MVPYLKTLWSSALVFVISATSLRSSTKVTVVVVAALIVSAPTLRGGTAIAEAAAMNAYRKNVLQKRIGLFPMHETAFTLENEKIVYLGVICLKS